MIGKLYVVGTPIGNLGDFSPRAEQILNEVNFIAAEDTRVSIKLLNRFNIKTPMISYHEHNHKLRGEQIIERLLTGETCALVTDAGMPAVSDPGEDLVKLCHEHGVPVESVPGPSAVITALAISGMPSGRFCFEGFLTTNKTGRKEHLSALKNETRTMIFYEAPHKLFSTLKDMAEAFGDREVAIVKELTKLHETVMRTTLFEAVNHFEQSPPKGEYVLVLGGADEQKPQVISFEDAVLLAKELIKSGMTAPLAAKEAAKEAGLKKSDIYKALL